MANTVFHPEDNETGLMHSQEETPEPANIPGTIYWRQCSAAAGLEEPASKQDDGACKDGTQPVSGVQSGLATFWYYCVVL